MLFSVILAIHVATILNIRLQFSITCRANARLEHSQPEACMPQLRGVDRNHTASLVLVARFVKRPALGIRLVTNKPLDGKNDIAVVAEHAAKLGLELAALSGMRDDRAAFARVDEDAESELVGVVTARRAMTCSPTFALPAISLPFAWALARVTALAAAVDLETSSSVHIRLSCEEDAHWWTALACGLHAL